MDKKEALDFLKNALNETPKLRELHYDRPDLELWESKIMAVLKKVLDEDDYLTFAEAFPRSIPMKSIAPEESFRQHYQKKITLREVALTKILQQYEIFGIEEEPTEPPTAPQDSKEQKPSMGFKPPPKENND